MSDNLPNVDDIFCAAIELPSPEERGEYVDRACGGNAELRHRVDALLAAHFGAGDFLERSLATALLPDHENIQEGPGTLIGPYKLLEQIGEGGMGVVYMADQQAPVRRRVALKVIKTGMDTRQVIARFEAERQALALMDHSNIARVLDAGATDSGRPYFVMELVRGIPITEYCDQNNLPVHERLELFVQVCSAVQHAHQKGIIHRDLKPSNVLVTLNDGRAVPKVIDFGVAKATGQQLTEKTLFTAFAQMVGTPLYMSPEQAEMTSVDIDTRSDIYSLGVLLYELLTGTTPFDQQRMRAAAFDEIRRIIREEEPPKPSTRISTLGDSRTATAAHRQVDAHRLGRLVEGDLDWIVMKALEKDRTRRYDTAGNFAADVLRHLSDQPVEARSASRTYRLRKFIRRNKVGVLAGSAIVAALLVGLILALAGYQEARRQAQIARTEATRSEHVAQFLKDMLKGVGPSVARGRDTTMLQEIVDKTAVRIGTVLKNEPEVEIELRNTLAQVYFDIQHHKAMEQTARESLRVARRQFGEENLAVANALNQIGHALFFLRRMGEAETFSRQAIVMYRKLQGTDSLKEAEALDNLGNVLRHQGKLNECETSLRMSLAMRRKILGGDDEPCAWTLHSLSIGFVFQGRYAEAEGVLREAISIRQRIYGDESPFIGADLSTLCWVLSKQGKLDEAETTGRHALELQERIEGKGKLAQFATHRNLADILRMQGNLAEAERHYREAVTIGKIQPGADYLDVALPLVHLAKLRQLDGKLDEARTLAEEAVAICDRNPDRTDQPTKDTAFAALQVVLMELGDTSAIRALAIRLISRGEHSGDDDEIAAAYALAIPMLIVSDGKVQARQLCHKLLALTPQSGRPYNGVAWFLATVENPTFRDPELAVELAAIAVKLNPDSGKYWNTLGVSRYRAGEWKLSIEALEKSMELLKGGDAFDWFFLAMARWQLGHKDKARTWFDNAVEWMDKNQPKNEELIRFRAETAELLGISEPAKSTGSAPQL